MALLTEVTAGAMKHLKIIYRSSLPVHQHSVVHRLHATKLAVSKHWRQWMWHSNRKEN